MNTSRVAATEDQIVLATQKPQDSTAGNFLDLIYAEAFERLAMTFVYKNYPAKRCSILSDLGKVDGELSRIHSYNNVHPNLIRVEEPHWTSGFIAVATDPSIHLDGWESLEGTDYMVNFRRGIKGCEVNLPKVVRPDKLEIVNEPSLGLKKLLAGRADLYIGAEHDISRVLESDKFKNSGLYIVGVMETFTAHAFLHKKHKELVPKLSNVLKEMKQEGLFEKYRNALRLPTYIKE